MKVKISNTVFDSEDEPIMLILSKTDRENIAQMDDAATMYCSFPVNSESNEIRKFMKIDKPL